MGHPIRNGAANLSAFIFESTLNPLVKIADTVASVINAANGSVSGDIIAGEAIGSLSKNMKATVEVIGNSLQPTGYALCFLFFLIALVELAMSERMTMEYFIKFFSKLVIGVAAVFYWYDIYETFRGLGNALSGIISTSGPGVETTIDLHPAFNEYVSGEGASSWLILLVGSVLIGAPLLITSFVIVGVVYVVVFTWLLEFSIRACFLPIACSLLSDDGWRGSGGRYIRKFIGVACQGAVMVTVSKLTSDSLYSIVSTLGNSAANVTDADENFKFLTDLAQTIIVVVAICVATVSVMFKASAIVSDVFGG